MTESDERAMQREPDVEELNNGAVRVVLDIADPATSLGIVTDTVSVEADGPVTEDLMAHIWNELLIDGTDYDIEVFE